VVDRQLRCLATEVPVRDDEEIRSWPLDDGTHVFIGVEGRELPRSRTSAHGDCERRPDLRDGVGA
jgi:hypothetical protein